MDTTPQVPPTPQEEEENEHKPGAWKAQRKRLKEWKWVDIDLGNYEDYNFLYAVFWVIAVVLFFMPFIDVVLDVILVHQMYDVRSEIQTNVTKHLNVSAYCDPNATRTHVVYFGQGSVFPCNTLIHALLIMVVLYAFFALLSFLFSVYDLWFAYTIVKSDDVSDAFIDQVTNRLHSVRWYSHFCVFQAVSNEQTYTDQLVVFVYQTLRAGKQLIADVPHFVMAIIFSFLIHQLNTSTLANENTITTILKLVLLVFRILCFLGCLIAYPFLRICVADSSLQLYASFLIEKRLDLTLWTQKHKFSEDPSITNITVTQDPSLNGSTTSPPQSPAPSQPLLSDSSTPMLPPGYSNDSTRSAPPGYDSTRSLPPGYDEHENLPPGYSQ